MTLGATARGYLVHLLECGAASFFALACASEAGGEDPVARGRSLFESGALSASGENVFACSTCHDARTPTRSELKPGALLAGATLRPSYWGGQENDLLRAIDDCRAEFMYDASPLVPGRRDADAFYAYLASLEPGDARPVAFTVVGDIADVPRGDAAHGAALFTSACAPCHGAMHTGVGNLSDRIPVLPEATLAAHAPPTYTPRLQRLVFIEKTRHGLFLKYGGDMPPFSTEVLPDADLSDLLEGLGVLGL